MQREWGKKTPEEVAQEMVMRLSFYGEKQMRFPAAFYMLDEGEKKECVEIFRQRKAAEQWQKKS